eukprot:m.184964 g.184964  ORF g.184964 m.184964 type:complete len:250 (-) comp14725_c1_seq2:457-1206(-)
MAASDCAQFDRAVAFVSHPECPPISDKVKLQLYGLYKQVTVGDCNTSKPAMWNATARAKWGAWNNNAGKGTEDAMNEYVAIVQQSFPDWASGSRETTDAAKPSRLGFGPVMSMPSIEQDEEEHAQQDIQPSFHHHVSNGNLEGVRAMLNQDPSHALVIDEEGMTPLHWSADRGHFGVTELLVHHGAAIDLRDNSGDTALHNAALCGHSEVVELLLKKGASPSIANSSGETPRDVADDPSIHALFSQHAQ